LLFETKIQVNPTFHRWEISPDIFSKDFCISHIRSSTLENNRNRSSKDSSRSIITEIKELNQQNHGNVYANFIAFFLKEIDVFVLSKFQPMCRMISFLSNHTTINYWWNASDWIFKLFLTFSHLIMNMQNFLSFVICFRVICDQREKEIQVEHACFFPFCTINKRKRESEYVASRRVRSSSFIHSRPTSLPMVFFPGAWERWSAKVSKCNGLFSRVEWNLIRILWFISVSAPQYQWLIEVVQLATRKKEIFKSLCR